ncbi:hypothetical protein ACJX0J_032051, partial [Zea mays]
NCVGVVSCVFVNSLYWLIIDNSCLRIFYIVFLITQFYFPICATTTILKAFLNKTVGGTQHIIYIWKQLGPPETVSGLDLLYQITVFTWHSSSS